jgi:ribosome biogenesis protein ENP2
MAVSVSEFNGVKAYNFSFGKSLPDSIENVSKKKNVAQDAEFKKKVELIYDFQFNSSSQNLEVTRDGNYIVSTGIYPPRLKIFDVNDMALKCERGIDSEIIKLKMLSDDYKKVAMACVDRHIEVHAQYGRHYKVRIPKMPRDMDYNPFTCDLFVSGSDEEIYRLNLEEGKFMSSLKCTTPEINKILFHPGLDLLFAGSAGGLLNAFDYRQRSL